MDNMLGRRGLMEAVLDTTKANDVTELQAIHASN
jgi:hypothetical protein